jgi:Flp pilus assembly pilin Flp
MVHKLWTEDVGQDIAEYAVMLAVILVLVVGTIRLIGGSANNVFSPTASSIGHKNSFHNRKIVSLTSFVMRPWLEWTLRSLKPTSPYAN